MQKDTSSNSSMSPATRRVIVKWIVQSALGVVGYGIILFLGGHAGLDLGMGAAGGPGRISGRPSSDPDPDQPRAAGPTGEGAAGKGGQSVGSLDRFLWRRDFAYGLLDRGGARRALWLDRAAAAGCAPGQPGGDDTGLCTVPVGDGLQRLLRRGGAHPNRARPYRGHGRPLSFRAPSRLQRGDPSFVATPFLPGSLWALIPALAGSALYGADSPGGPHAARRAARLRSVCPSDALPAGSTRVVRRTRWLTWGITDSPLGHCLWGLLVHPQAGRSVRRSRLHGRVDARLHRTIYTSGKGARYGCDPASSLASASSRSRSARL